MKKKVPKLKVRKSLLKRFRITKNGKILRRGAFTGHLKASKSKKRLRNLKRVKQMTGFFAKKLRKAMGK